MTDDERLEDLLRSALRRPSVRGPSRDLWPLIVERSRTRVEWFWLDLGIAAIVAVMLLVRPGWLWLLVYHL
jgi:hypothetical protein